VVAIVLSLSFALFDRLGWTAEKADAPSE